MKQNSEDFATVYKGKLSLAEALKDLETVKKAFDSSERIETRLISHDNAIQDLITNSSFLAPFTFVDTRIDELKSSLNKIIREKFEEFSVSYFSQLNEKLNRTEIDTFVSNRCTWVAFNSLTQNVGSLTSRMDKHIFSDFEGLKTKIKVQFGDKHIEMMNETARIKEEFALVKARMNVVEQKLQEMFVDDGLGDSEDYDSQEENDNINQNLEGGKDSLESSEEEGPKPDVQKPNFQITVSEVKEAPEAKQEVTEKLQEVAKNYSVAEPVVAPQQGKVENAQIVKKEAKIVVKNEEKSEPKVQQKIEVKEEPKVEVKEEPKIEAKVIAEVKIEPKVQEPPPAKVAKPETKIVENPEPKAIIKPEPPVIPANVDSKKPEKPAESLVTAESNQLKPEPTKPEPDSKAAALEIPDRAHRRRDDDAASSRHRRGGSSAGDPNALSRKNSLSSSMGPGNANVAGGLRGINKKVVQISKDIEGLRQTTDEHKGVFDELKEEFTKVYDKISRVRERCEEIETIRKGMEMSFIKALRRSGKDKKSPQKPQVTALSGEDLKKIYAQLAEKGQKMTSIESSVEKVALDMQYIKTNLKDKMNEIITTLHTFDTFRKELLSDNSFFESKLKEIDERLEGLGSSIYKEVNSIKGPMTNLISDQQREHEVLEENLKRQQVNFREIMDECSVSMRNIMPDTFLQSRLSTARPGTRKSVDSPKISVKHKFFETNNTFRVSNPNLKTEDNWLAGYPDGRTLALPKVGIESSKRSLTVVERKKPERKGFLEKKNPR